MIVVEAEGEGVGELVCGVVADGVGVGVGVGVAFSSPSTSPHPTVSIAIVFSATCPFTTAVFLKVLPIVALAGIFSSV